jgi:hypothetical protein
MINDLSSPDEGSPPSAALPESSPGNTLGTADPGDDVQLRFRYQHAYAAIQCLSMLSANGGPAAVYCENHEDVLIENKDGKFVGVQVKTRKPSLPPFKSTDEPFMKAVRRFSRLMQLFPDWFTAFNFATNHRFWEDGRTPANPLYLIRFLRDRGGAKGLRTDNPVRAYLNSVCAEGHAKEVDLVAALLKLNLASYESDLRHNYRDLIDIIGQTRGLASTCTLNAVYRIADNLIHRIFMASSQELGGNIVDLYKPDANMEQVRDKLLLAGKKLVPADIESVIDQSLPDSASNLLVTSGFVPADVLPPGMDVMRQKLAAGGVQQSRVGVIEDSVASIQKTYMEWTYKNEVKTANDRLQHLQALVRDDCAEAQVQASAESNPYGPKMYSLLRARLKERVVGSDPLFECSDRHLLGVAGTLTEECKVWWSEPFTVKAKQD